MVVEVEIRSFIDKHKYLDLIEFFTKKGELVSEDEQVTYYFDSEQDLRIQRNNFFSKIWLKKGKLHDEHREEIEVKTDKENFEKLEQLFLSLGYVVEIKWFRKRHTFNWENVTVMVDYTKGYGYILEMEKLVEEGDEERALELLKQRFNQLGIAITPKEVFKEKYEYYRKNWKQLV